MGVVDVEVDVLELVLVGGEVELEELLVEETLALDEVLDEELDGEDVEDEEDTEDEEEDVEVEVEEEEGFARARYAPAAATIIIITTITATIVVETATLLFEICFKANKQTGRVATILIVCQFPKRLT